MIRVKLLAAATAVGLLGLPLRAAQANLVLNSGFETETGGGPPWSPPDNWAVGSVTDPESGNTVADAGADDALPNNGNRDAYLGDGTLSQILATTIGTTYTITWSVTALPQMILDSGASFTASFDGVDMLSGTPISPGDVAGGYTQYSATVTATSTATLLAFTGLSSGDSGLWYLDDVSVVAQTGNTNVPEPSGGLLLLTAIGAVRWVRRRRG